jgi:hypothetical protein
MASDGEGGFEPSFWAVCCLFVGLCAVHAVEWVTGRAVPEWVSGAVLCLSVAVPGLIALWFSARWERSNPEVGDDDGTSA